MADPLDMNPEDRDAMAAQYALGVLEQEELAAAQRLFLANREFADSVRWWRYRLAAMAEEAGEIEPSRDVWPAIERRLASGDAQGGGGSGSAEILSPGPRRGFGWGIALAMAGSAAAAAVLTFIAVQPAVSPPVAPVETGAPAQGERLIAQRASEDGSLRLAGYVDPQASEIAINLAGFAPGEGQATELWVVPEGGAPQSLGLVPETGRLTRSLTAQERAALVSGASLAVTYEDATGAPHAAPTSDILVIGTLAEV